MVNTDLLIKVAFAGRERQSVVELCVAHGTSARSAVVMSGLQSSFPEIAFSRCSLGRFGCLIDDDIPVNSGDRIEIYRPLELSPKEIRRRRAGRR